jgi:tetratricopeptide (TPR) repeat protein
MKSASQFRLRVSFYVFLIFCYFAAASLPMLLRAQGTNQGGTNTPDQQASSGDQLAQEELRGDSLVAQKMYADGLAVYKALLAKHPHSAPLLNKIGIASFHLNKFGDAKHYYQLALRADPKYASAANNIGTIYYQQRKYKRAIKEYKHAIAIGPELGSFDSNLGYAYFSDKQYDQAMVAFRRALELDPTLFEQHSLTGTALMQRSVEDRGMFFFFIAKSYAQMGDAERCAQYLRKARDEGFAKILTAKTDPAFAGVREHPLVKQVLDSLTVEGKRNSSS